MSEVEVIQIEVVLPVLYKKQHDAFYCKERFSYIEGSTKSGKTHGAMIWQMSQVLQKKGVHWWIAPIHRTAKIPYDRMKAALQDPKYSALVKSFKDTVLTIEFVNGSVWVFKSGDNYNGLYGEECESVVLDEASRMSEEVFNAALSTLSTTVGPMRIVGNVTTRGNWFYKHSRNAENGERNSRYTRLTVHDAIFAGLFTEEALEDAKSKYTTEEFNALFLCIPIEAEGSPFPSDLLDPCLTDEPLSGEPVVFGLDIGGIHDYTVLIGLAANGDVVSIHRLKADQDETLSLVRRVVSPNVPILIDSTGVGQPYFTNLQRTHSAIRFVFNKQTKYQMVFTIKTALKEQQVRIPRNSVLARELEEYEQMQMANGNIVYSSPSGLHDDTVDAFGLALIEGKKRGLIRRETDGPPPPLFNPAVLVSRAGSNRRATYG